MEPGQIKRCYGCHELLALDEFHRNRSARDGRASACKACTKVYQARYLEKRAATKGGAEKLREAQREYNRKYRAKLAAAGVLKERERMYRERHNAKMQAIKAEDARWAEDWWQVRAERARARGEPEPPRPKQRKPRRPSKAKLARAEEKRYWAAWRAWREWDGVNTDKPAELD